MNWTNVNEKLPEYDQDVLIWTPAGVQIARLWEICKCGDTDHFSQGDWCGNLDDITHWMFLPKGPVSKNDKLGRPKKTKRELNKSFNSSLKKKQFNFWV